MSTDPKPFEEDLEALEPEIAPDEAAEPILEPGEKKKGKKPKLKKVKAKKPARAKTPSEGFHVSAGELFPNVYTSLLGIAALAIIIAVVLLVIEFFVHYGGERGPVGGAAAMAPTTRSVTLSMTA